MVQERGRDPRLLPIRKILHKLDLSDDGAESCSFYGEEVSSEAYLDEPISIGHAQVTTQPSLIASMVEALRLTGTVKVLEIGTGFGFQTAIVSKLCHQVFSIERLAELVTAAESNLRKAGIENAKVVVGDGDIGIAGPCAVRLHCRCRRRAKVPQPLAARR